MNSLDTIIIVIVGAAFVMSLFRGVIKEVFALGSVILGFLIASRTHGQVAAFLTAYMDHAPTARIVAYGVVFVGASVAIRILGSFVEKLVKKSLLGWVDHLAGSLFGLLKGCLIVSVLIMVLTAFAPDSRVLTESRLTPRIISTVGLLATLSPADMKQRFADARERLEQTWSTAIQKERQEARGLGSQVEKAK
ncbi:MAG: CvpA family protein [bacterium]|nr:CvpA family protein [bacterium]